MQGQDDKGKDNEERARIGRERKMRCDARNGRKDKGGLVKGRKEVRKEGMGRTGEEKKVVVKWIKQAGSDEASREESRERKEGMTRRNTSFFCACLAQSPS